MNPALTGFVTGLSLIVAIGAQNAYVLRQGLARNRVGVIVAICALSDAALILAGTLGLGSLVVQHPTMLTIARYAGAAYLVAFGLRSWWAAAHPSDGLHADSGRGTAVVSTTLALTFLNPHVYLDTVLMLGSIGAQQGDQGRWLFAAGAAVGSVLWFATLGFGARALAPMLARPVVWRVVDVLVGVTMMVVAVKLLQS